MDSYGEFIWPAYLFATLILFLLVIFSVKSLKKSKRIYKNLTKKNKKK
ncbi:MAG TPA: hypothetical protein DCG52_06210 [Alphaproteobacteria bacterium]|nr:hypothetical protein [Alphaproteobacteria bacterium]|tara:strand:+ start:1338 stop:1481 length:144 start_codon:yes stop_codon:yes gene_type:complete